MAEPIQLTGVLLDQAVAIFAHLYQENEHMTQQVKDLQTVSTAQVERIRSLERELAQMKEQA